MFWRDIMPSRWATHAGNHYLTNENNVLDELVQTGVYHNTGSRITSSPSMDIAKASNLERVVRNIES